MDERIKGVLFGQCIYQCSPTELKGGTNILQERIVVITSFVPLLNDYCLTHPKCESPIVAADKPCGIHSSRTMQCKLYM